MKLFLEAEEHYAVPGWSRQLLITAAVYNLLFGLVVLLFPELILSKLATTPPDPPVFWQLTGLMVGIYGLSYFLAATDVERYWPLVLVGFAGKLGWLLFFLISVAGGALSASFGWIVLFNSVIWLVPFYMILRKVYLQFVYEFKPLEEEDFFEQQFELVITNRGMNLMELSEQRPVLLIFLRHFGCSFCRQMLQDIHDHRAQIEAENKEIVLVHMADYDVAKKILRKYNLQDLHHISDQERKIYRYFGLRRGRIKEVLGWKTWGRRFRAAVKGHKDTLPEGDTFQLPGVFLYYRGKILDKYIHKTAADQPDLVSLAKVNVHPQ